MKLSVKEIKEYLGISEDCQIAIVHLTPDMADTLLAENNVHNRKMNMSRVAFIQEQIKRGDFFLSTDCIGFDDKGNIVNAQHRLSAVATLPPEYSESRYPFGVMFGVRQQMDFDTGKRRTLQDNAMLCDDYDPRLKDPDKAICLKVISNAVQYMTGHLTKRKYTQKELMEITNSFADQLIECYDLGLFQKVADIPPVAYAAFFVAYLCGVDAEVMLQIIDVFKKHDFGGSKNNPIYALSKLFVREKNGNSVRIKDRYIGTQACIRAVAKGSTASRLSTEKFIYVYTKNKLVK